MPISDSVEIPHDCERLFCFWTGDNPMSPNRLKALTTMANSGLEVIFLTKENIEGWVLDSDPLHPAFQYLSAIHRADYLRMYFMHHYGGGYSDIKNINHSWIAAAEKLKTSSRIELGFKPKPSEVKRLNMFLIVSVLPMPDSPNVYIFKIK